MNDTTAMAQMLYLLAAQQVKYPSEADYQNSGVNTGEGGVSRHSYYQSLVIQKATEMLSKARIPDPNSKGFPYIMDPLLVMLGQPTAENAQIKTFVSIIESVELEEKSMRALVKFRGAPTKANADGREEARTDRIDGYQAHGLLVANQAKSLIGHKVRVTVQVEVTGSGRKSRAIKHLHDMGQAKPEDYQPREQRGNGQGNQGGGFNQGQQSQGGFNQGNGGFNQGQGNGGFNQSQSQGGFNQGNGGFNQSQSQGGFNQGNGGF